MKRSAGFTLIEMLVALTLLGLVFVLLFGGLRFGMRAWEHGRNTGDATGDVRGAQDFLRNSIARACPELTTTSIDAPPQAAFSGTETTLAMRAPAPQASGACSPMTLARTRDGKLTVSFGGTPAILLDRVATLAIAYLGPDGRWQPALGGALPRLIRLRVTFPAGDPRIWPELFVAPRISGAADCTYDTRFKSCRGG